MKNIKRSLSVGVVLIAMLLFVTAISAADSKEEAVESYVVVMALDPLLGYDGHIEGLAETKSLVGSDTMALDTDAIAYRSHLMDSHVASIEAADVAMSQKIHDYTVTLNGYSALLTENQVRKIESQDGVLVVMKDEMRQAQTDSTGKFLGLTGNRGAWANGLTGEDVIVGVIDSGIWPEHPSFADDGSYSDLGVVLDESVYPACDFGNTAHNADDAPFTCNNKLIGARQILPTYRAVIGADPDEFDSARDDDGHGSHTAGTAAGNAGVSASMYGIDRGTISGVAPRARIIAYKGLGNLGGFGSDLAAAIDQAVLDGVDVINYSVGGGASLIGADDLAYLFAADAGVWAATSAGNSGSGAGTVGGPGSVPWITTVGASTQHRSFNGKIRLGDGEVFIGASITPGTDGQVSLVDAEDVGGELCLPDTLDPDAVAGKIVLCKRGQIGRAAKSLSVQQAGGVGMILFNASNVDNLFTDNHLVPTVHLDLNRGEKIKKYIDQQSNPTARIISMKNPGRIDYAPSMTIFSSRGSNTVAEDIIKPDITAPGHQILAATSPFPDPGARQGENFMSISGTSMSSPHVAGIFALLKQVHPDWTPAMAKSAIMTTAYQYVRDNDRRTLADPFDMGAGHIDPRKPNNRSSLFRPGLVYDAGRLDYLGFLCDAAPEAFSNPAGTCAALEGLGIQTDASNLNLASIGIAELPGTQTVVRTVTSVAEECETITYKPYPEAPAGYTVSVSPPRIFLAPGESAEYTVTITNNGDAPVGEWRFGHLIWRSAGLDDSTCEPGEKRARRDSSLRFRGKYEVRSPIAVRASLLDTPPELAGVGVDGSSSVPVKFGYDGSYTAAAHGLEAATVTSGSVAQDPDQNFDPTDGFSDSITITTSGAALLRIAMPPEAVASADVDIDLFLADPTGAIVATSTNGGTDELIDISLPADGDWTLYIHGWQAAGETADYDLYTWVVSATPGGNMSVDSAPASAVIGDASSVDVSWTGAAAGEWHLGAVSHAGDDGLIGLTVINVDNR